MRYERLTLKAERGGYTFKLLCNGYSVISGDPEEIDGYLRQRMAEGDTYQEFAKSGKPFGGALNFSEMRREWATTDAFDNK